MLRRDKPDALMLGIELADASPLIGLAGGVVQQRDPKSSRSNRTRLEPWHLARPARASAVATRATAIVRPIGLDTEPRPAALTLSQLGA